MSVLLAGIPDLQLHQQISLATITRFGLGGFARWLADAGTPKALEEAVRRLRESNAVYTVIGGGSNLVVSDEPYDGVIVRYREDSIRMNGTLVTAGSGALLQDLVDFTIENNLGGLETMTGIPGWVGGAVYGNAGAYGRSLDEAVDSVRYFDGTAFREIGRSECGFRYRDSIFKQKKDRIVVSVKLRLETASGIQLAETARGIRKIRDEKYPPTMRCAGSIFKNLLWIELPQAVRETLPPKIVRDGKVPSAYFLEQTGVKGMRMGGIEVAEYHANLIYNAGGGTSRDARKLIDELKRRVRERFGIELEEEVQYVPAELGRTRNSLRSLRGMPPKQLK